MSNSSIHQLFSNVARKCLAHFKDFNGPTFKTLLHVLTAIAKKSSLNAYTDISSGTRGLIILSELLSTSILCVCEKPRL